MSAIVKLTGVRIEKSEFYQQKQYTVVAVPAPDAFSHPSKFRVSSAQPLGNVGNVINLELSMRGVVRPKTFVDRNTNQQKSFDECDVYFDVIKSEVHVSTTQQKVNAG